MWNSALRYGKYNVETVDCHRRRTRGWSGLLKGAAAQPQIVRPVYGKMDMDILIFLTPDSSNSQQQFRMSPFACPISGYTARPRRLSRRRWHLDKDTQGTDIADVSSKEA